MTSIVSVLDDHDKWFGGISAEKVDGIFFHTFKTMEGMTTSLIHKAREYLNSGKTVLFVSAEETRESVLDRMKLADIDIDNGEFEYQLSVCGPDEAWPDQARDLEPWDAAIFDDANLRFGSKVGVIMGLKDTRDLGTKVHIGWRENR